VDTFDRTTSRSVVIKRDATKPIISDFTVSGSPNANGWYNTGVNGSWNCSDVTSKPVSSFGNASLANEGANQTLTATCVDNADNSTSETKSGINIDRTPPTLAPSLPSNTLDLNAVASATPNAADALSGIESASCDPVVTSAAGSFSVNCTAKDKAGNTTT